MGRLVLARALYQEREILFLDESTASLDEEMEDKIISNLLNNYKDKTIIAIVHKEKLVKKYKIIKLYSRLKELNVKYKRNCML